jgi:serine/threonine-protein kinase
MTGTSLAHYLIGEKLGQGGMGTVYRATDTKLGREVAIKVLPPSLAEDSEYLARFQREARVLASLNHTNISSVYAVENNAIVMELVAGEPLRGPEPVEKALSIARQILDGLEAAHRAGVIHRDLKPDNILMVGDKVKIIDFGLARAVATIADDDATAIHITQPHTVIGTAAYMSPEQAQGRLADVRSDIWAFGAVLYELIGGRQAFEGETSISVLAAVLHRDPPPLSAVPSEVDAVIRRCLSKDPKERFQSAGEVRDALAKPLTPPAPSIAVLPFVNLNHDEEGEFIADGITEDLISALSRLSGLRVAGRSMAFQFKGQNLTARVAGQQLRVGNVLEGTIRRSGKRLRVSVQLIDVADGFPVWSERYDRIIEDVFDIQDEISKAIVDTLEVRLGAKCERLIVRPTTNIEAWQLCVEGRTQWSRRTPESFRRAMECFKRAIELDERYALAWSGLADVHALLAVYGVIPANAGMPTAREAAKRALELDPGIAEAHASLGIVTAFWEWNWTTAKQYFRRAIELNPRVAHIHHWYGNTLMAQSHGNADEALEHMRKARQADPVSPSAHYGLGSALAMLFRLDEAKLEIRATLSLDPAHPLANYNLATIAILEGRFDEAQDHIQRIQMHSLQMAALGDLAARRGDRAEALRILCGLEEIGRQRYVSRFPRAVIRGGLGDVDEMLTEIEACADERDPLFPFMMHTFFLPETTRGFRRSVRAWASIPRLPPPCRARGGRQHDRSVDRS